ncbi:flagellar protein FlaG [Azonexus hydrophilus]|uniref:flagellar protein FlaG n=1 Tax=Azonexus hydrophilus TaxID=418702 RepID=UPI00197AC4CC|nr:flagellar protein FlaG [Azonexus hydrophilus]
MMNIESINTAGASQRPQEASGQTVSRQTAVKNGASVNNQSESIQPSKQETQKKQDLSVENAVERLSKFVANTKAEISFSIDQESGIQVVKVLDSQTKDVIRQFPSEEAIQLAQALDKLQGLLVKDKA